MKFKRYDPTECRRVDYSTLQIGDTFRIADQHFMKTELTNSQGQAAVGHNGYITYFHPTVRVIRTDDVWAEGIDKD